MIFSLLSGCLSNARKRGVVFDTSPIKNVQEITLENNIIDAYGPDYKRGFSYNIILIKGLYISKFKSPDGIFYEGPRDGVIQNFEEGSKYISTGGFFIPNNAKESLRWWFEGGSRMGWDKNGRQYPARWRSHRVDSTADYTGTILGRRLSPENSINIRAMFK